MNYVLHYSWRPMCLFTTAQKWRTGAWQPTTYYVKRPLHPFACHDVKVPNRLATRALQEPFVVLHHLILSLSWETVLHDVIFSFTPGSSNNWNGVFAIRLLSRKYILNVKYTDVDSATSWLLLFDKNHIHLLLRTRMKWLLQS